MRTVRLVGATDTSTASWMMVQGGGKTQTTTSQTGIPADVLARYNTVNQNAQNVSQQPFQQYSTNPSSFVAPINPQENLGIGQTNDFANVAQPYFTAASGLVNQGYGTGSSLTAQGLSAGVPLVQAGQSQGVGLTNAGAAAANPTTLNAAAINKYLSPYLSQVLGSTQKLVNQTNQQAQAGQLGNAITSGAFGGDRSGVAAANLAGQQELAAGNLYAGIENQGYNTALQTAQQQQGLSLSAQQANLARKMQAGQQIYGMDVGAGQALSGMYGTAGAQQAQLANQAAQQQGAIGAGAQTAGLQGAQQRLAAGQLQQQTTQAGNTAMYQQFLQQQGYPFQVAQFLANIAEGTGSLSGSTTTTQQPAPFFSDERLKDDVEVIGKSFDGLNIVKFKYKGSPQKHIGLLADDVERRHPEAVGQSHGYKTVDYDAATREAAGLGGRHTYAAGGVPIGVGGGPADWYMLQQLLANGQAIEGATPGAQYLPGAGMGAVPYGGVKTLGNVIQQGWRSPGRIAAVNQPPHPAQTGLQQLGDLNTLVKTGTQLKDEVGAGYNWLSKLGAAPAPVDTPAATSARGGYLHRASGGDIDPYGGSSGYVPVNDESQLDRDVQNFKAMQQGKSPASPHNNLGDIATLASLGKTAASAAPYAASAASAVGSAAGSIGSSLAAFLPFLALSSGGTARLHRDDGGATDDAPLDNPARQAAIEELKSAIAASPPMNRQVIYAPSHGAGAEPLHDRPPVTQGVGTLGDLSGTSTAFNAPMPPRRPANLGEAPPVEAALAAAPPAASAPPAGIHINIPGHEYPAATERSGNVPEPGVAPAGQHTITNPAGMYTTPSNVEGGVAGAAINSLTGTYPNSMEGHRAFLQTLEKKYNLTPGLLTGIGAAEGNNPTGWRTPNLASAVDVENGKPFSFGDLQFNMKRGALGDIMLQQSGIDARDPKQWQAADEWGAKYMAEHGVAPWKGDRVAAAYMNSGAVPAGMARMTAEVPGGGGSGARGVQVAQNDNRGLSGVMGGLGGVGNAITSAGSNAGNYMNANQNWLVPLLTGLGTMAGSNSRYLGAAALQGLGGAAGAYENVQNEQMNRALQNPVLQARNISAVNELTNGWMNYKATTGQEISLPDYAKMVGYNGPVPSPTATTRPVAGPPVGGGAPATAAAPAAAPAAATTTPTTATTPPAATVPQGTQPFSYSLKEYQTGTVKRGDNVIPLMNDALYLQGFIANHSGQQADYIKGQVEAARNRLAQINASGQTTDVSGATVNTKGAIPTGQESTAAASNVAQSQHFKEAGITFNQGVGPMRQSIDDLQTAYTKLHSGALADVRAYIDRLGSELDPTGSHPLLHPTGNSAGEYDTAIKSAAMLMASQLKGMSGAAPASEIGLLEQFAAEPSRDPTALRNIITRSKAALAYQEALYNGFDAAKEGYDLGNYTKKFNQQHNYHDEFLKPALRGTPWLAGQPPASVRNDADIADLPAGTPFIKPYGPQKGKIGYAQ